MVTSSPSVPSRGDPPSGTTPTPVTPTTGYRAVEVIAKGGMGRVELVARQEGRFRRLYARKRLHEHMHEDPDFQSMFLDEARVAGLIDHPNVVGVLDVGTDADGPFLIMPYVHGLSLSRVISLSRKAKDRLPLQVVLRIALDVARGLHAAHEVKDGDGHPLGLVHRDLSPQNVMVGFDGTARVTDFGIAKALGQSTRTSTGVAKGKHAYMSPEQLTFRAVDRRSDLFALGIVIYEMLAGRRLYGGMGSDGPRSIIEDPPPDIGEERQGLPPALVELLFELLAKSPAERPDDASRVATRLEVMLAQCVAEEPVEQVADYLASIAAEDRLQLEERQRRAMASSSEASVKIAAPTRDTDTALAAPPSMGGTATIPDERRRGRAIAVTLAIGGTLVIAGLAWLSLEGSPASEPEAVAPIAPAASEPTTTIPTPTPTTTAPSAPATAVATPTPTPTPPPPASAEARTPPRTRVSRVHRPPPTTRTSTGRVGWDEEAR